MESRKIYIFNRACGFTLVEILVVMAIFLALATLGLFMSMDSTRVYATRFERDTLVSMLQKARSRSMSNASRTSWGACTDSIDLQYVLFRGSKYVEGASANERTNMSGAIGITSVPPLLNCADGGVVFSTLSATTTPLTITLTQNNRSYTVSINYEGTIDY